MSRYDLRSGFSFTGCSVYIIGLGGHVLLIMYSGTGSYSLPRQIISKFEERWNDYKSGSSTQTELRQRQDSNVCLALKFPSGIPEGMQPLVVESIQELRALVTRSLGYRH